MKRMIIYFTCFSFITSLLFCVEEESYEQRLYREQMKYDSLVTKENKELIARFMKDSLEISENFGIIDSGFYCMWKEREIKIIPHLALNKLFVSNDYNITLSPDSLRYIIVSETLSHPYGTYSNGAEAVVLENVISVIDLYRKKAFKLANRMGSSPPSSTTSSTVDIGDFWGDEDIYENLKIKIKKKDFEQ